MFKARGRIWKFGDEIDTDVMTSGKFLNLPMDELKQHVFDGVRPEFASNVRPGDIIIAGRNFGCGSSRETAPAALKALEIGAVVAVSFARIFYRNAIAIGLPAIICPGAYEAFQEGEEALIDLDQWQIVHVAKGTTFQVEPLPSEMLRVLTCGGIESLLKEIQAARSATGRPLG